MGGAAERILCITSYEKGQDFLRQCAAMGVKPTLLTVEKLSSNSVFQEQHSASRNRRRMRH